MRISPRYGDVPVLVMDGDEDDQRVPIARQRRRLQTVLEGLTDTQWRFPSRCAGWTVQDVVAHLAGTNGFWYASAVAGLAGQPTRMLEGFDPAATPALLVDSMRSLSPAETFAQFAESNEALVGLLESLDLGGWRTLAESPPGHVPIRLLAQHALWDAWVHERDVLVPLGMAPDEVPDEVASCLRYAAAVGPAFMLTVPPVQPGTLVVDGTEPDVHVVVEVDDRVSVHGGTAPPDAASLVGRSVDLVEQLSVRAPLQPAVPDDRRWLVAGLPAVFDADAG